MLATRAAIFTAVFTAKLTDSEECMRRLEPEELRG